VKYQLKITTSTTLLLTGLEQSYRKLLSHIKQQETQTDQQVSTAYQSSELLDVTYVQSGWKNSWLPQK